MSLAKAKVVRLTTLDGWGDIFWEDVPLGKIYYVDLDRIEELRHGQDGRAETVRRKFIWAAASDTGHAGWIPLEMFEIEAAA